MAGGLEAVYLHNRPTLLRFLRARGAGGDAEDLLQELWIRAESGSSEPISDPLAYLFRTANNLMLDRIRANARRGKREEAWAQTESPLGSGPVENPSPERMVMAREQLKMVEEALAELGERTTWIFRRFRIEGAGQRQIATELGISLSAVEKHLQKAYRALIDLQKRSDDGWRGAGRAP